MRPKILPAAILVAVVVSGVVRGAVVFEFNYTDAGSGSGFDDAVHGAARRNALHLAADTFATAFSSYNATIQLDANGNSPAGSLASGSGELAGPLTTGFGNHEVIRNKVLSNGANDLNSGAADGTIAVDFTTAWELDYDTTPSPTEYDFYSTIYHELAHTMGFASQIFTVNGVVASDYFSRTTGQWAKFDEYLSDANGNSVFTGATLDAATYESLLVGGASPADGLFFNGSGGRVGLYSPTSFLTGSSGSHLDDENPALAGRLMLAFVGTGPSARSFDQVELSILRDVGYTMVGQITAIPEPSALLLVGTCLMVTVFRMGVANRHSSRFGHARPGWFPSP